MSTETKRDSLNWAQIRRRATGAALPLGAAVVGVSTLIPGTADATHPNDSWKYLSPRIGSVEAWTVQPGDQKIIQAYWEWHQPNDRCTASDVNNRMGRYCHDNVTFELDVVLYNYGNDSFTNCGNAWATSYGSFWTHNMPQNAEAYQDTMLGDGSGEKSFSIGASNAGYLTHNVLYYWYTHVEGGEGVTCQNPVKVGAQKGHRILPFVYGDALNVDGDPEYRPAVPFNAGHTLPGSFYWEDCAYFDSKGNCIG